MEFFPSSKKTSFNSLFPTLDLLSNRFIILIEVIQEYQITHELIKPKNPVNQ